MPRNLPSSYTVDPTTGDEQATQISQPFVVCDGVFIDGIFKTRDLQACDTNSDIMWEDPGSFIWNVSDGADRWLDYAADGTIYKWKIPGTGGDTEVVVQELVNTDGFGVITRDTYYSLVERNDLGVTRTGTSRDSIMYMLHMSDIQIADEESPTLTPTNDYGFDGIAFQGALRPATPYLPYHADSMIQTAVSLQSNRDFDLAVHTGDAIENAQTNELNMFFSLLSGNDVVTNSGPVDEDEEDDGFAANQSFTAVGLTTFAGDEPMPLLSVLGNHDILHQGNFPLNLLELNSVVFDVTYTDDRGKDRTVGVSVFGFLQFIFHQLDISVPNTPVNMDDPRNVEAKIAFRSNLITPVLDGKTNSTVSGSTIANPYIADNGDGGVTDDTTVQDLYGMMDYYAINEAFMNGYSNIASAMLTSPVKGEALVDKGLATQDIGRYPLNKCRWIYGHQDPGDLFTRYGSTRLASDFDAPGVVGYGFGTFGAQADENLPSTYIDPNYAAIGTVSEGLPTDIEDYLENAECPGYYSIAKNNIRFIVLDTTVGQGGAWGAIGDSMKRVRYNDFDDTESVRVASESYSMANGVVLLNPAFTSEDGTTKTPLFTVVPKVQIGDSSSATSEIWNQATWLRNQVAAAESNDEAIVFVSHHASEDLVQVNPVRTLLEAVFCFALNKLAGDHEDIIAILPNKLDCETTDDNGAENVGFAFGKPSMDRSTVDSEANQKVLNLAANMLTGGEVTSWVGLTQTHVDEAFADEPDLSLDIITVINMLIQIREIIQKIPNTLSTADFRSILTGSDNVIAHLAGHNHHNEILAICDNGVAITSGQEAEVSGSTTPVAEDVLGCSAVGGTKGKGYWEIRTASNVDWPLEWRIVEFVDNNDGTMSIFTPVFSADPTDGSTTKSTTLANLSAKLTLTDSQTLGEDRSQPSGDAFTELLVTIPSALNKAFDEVNASAKPIETLTTLKK